MALDISAVDQRFEEDCEAAASSLGKLYRIADEELISKRMSHLNEIVSEKSNENVKKRAKSDIYVRNFGSAKQIVVRKHGKAVLNEICQFLIQTIRNWPEQKMQQMAGPTFTKFYTLGKEQGFFKTVPASTFTTMARNIVVNAKILDQLVENEDDKRLILDNLPKFGIGVRKGRKKVVVENTSDGFRFIIRLLRDWPKNKLDQMEGPIVCKIWELGKEEGLFQNISGPTFQNAIRNVIYSQRLDQYVENEDEKRLILENLPKLGIGVGKGRRSKEHKSAEKSSDPESRASSPNYIEVAGLPENHQNVNHFNDFINSTVNFSQSQNDSDRPKIEFDHTEMDFGPSKSDFGGHKINFSRQKINFSPQKSNFSHQKVHFSHQKVDFSPQKIDFSPSNQETTPERLRKVQKLDNFVEEKIYLQEKCAKLEENLNNLKQLLLFERKEKVSNYKQIEELSKQIDYHQQETIKQQKLANQLQSKIIEFENQIVVLNCQLSDYQKNVQEM